MNEELIRRFQIRSVGTAPFVGILCRGRVFILDRGSWGDFLLLLIKFVASRIGMELDRQILQRQTEEAAVARERIRLTRDLHDGILQSLTAARFQLKLLSDDQRDEDAQSRLNTIKQLLNNEQIRIRDFVRQTLPKSDAGTELVLSRDLRRVISELGELWECTTSFSVDPRCDGSGKIGCSSLAYAGGSNFQCGSPWRSFNDPRWYAQNERTSRDRNSR